jgi:hypothetical protein
VLEREVACPRYWHVFKHLIDRKFVEVKNFSIFSPYSFTFFSYSFLVSFSLYFFRVKFSPFIFFVFHFSKNCKFRSSLSSCKCGNLGNNFPKRFLFATILIDKKKKSRDATQNSILFEELDFCFFRFSLKKI